MARGMGPGRLSTGGAAGWTGWTPTLAWPPEPVHPMPQQHNPGQLHKGLSDVEIAQRADLEECHTQALRIGLGLFRGDLPLESQVQAVPHQDFRDPRGVLKGDRRARKVGHVQALLFVPWVSGVNGVHSEPQNVSFFGKRVCADVIN